MHATSTASPTPTCRSPRTRCSTFAKGERAFEIALARKMASGETDSTWFERHGSTPITELPAHWPDWYRRAGRAAARVDRDGPSS